VSSEYPFGYSSQIDNRTRSTHPMPKCAACCLPTAACCGFVLRVAAIIPTSRPFAVRFFCLAPLVVVRRCCRAPFGPCAVCRLRRLAFAPFATAPFARRRLALRRLGICALGHLRRWAFAPLGICAVRHLRRSAFVALSRFPFHPTAGLTGSRHVRPRESRSPNAARVAPRQPTAEWFKLIPFDCQTAGDAALDQARQMQIAPPGSLAQVGRSIRSLG